MKLLYIHNNYYLPSGEEHSAEAITKLLQEHGHDVSWYRRSSSELDKMFLGNLRALFLSIYNPAASRTVKKLIAENRFDVVQVQNLYPLISPRILKTIKALQLPVVMRCPNYRLFCPTGLFLDSSNEICERCTGHGKELWCIRKNCMGNKWKSVSYAIRNFVARTTGVFNRYVDLFIVQSEFQKRKLVEHGIPECKIEILPGLSPEEKERKSDSSESYITFVGRVSQEKGVDDFLAAARRLPDLKFAIAGNTTERTNYVDAPENVRWKGFLGGALLDELFENSAALVVPSKCYEGFPNVITRAMMHSRPVITTDIGCFPDIIDHGVNGYMYPPGDIDSLISHILWIIQNPDGAATMGRNGREKAEKQYSREVIYSKLMEIYSKAIEINKVDNKL